MRLYVVHDCVLTSRLILGLIAVPDLSSLFGGGLLSGGGLGGSLGGLGCNLIRISRSVSVYLLLFPLALPNLGSLFGGGLLSGGGLSSLGSGGLGCKFFLILNLPSCPSLTDTSPFWWSRQRRRST